MHKFTQIGGKTKDIHYSQIKASSTKRIHHSLLETCIYLYFVSVAKLISITIVIMPEYPTRSKTIFYLYINNINYKIDKKLDINEISRFQLKDFLHF